VAQLVALLLHQSFADQQDVKIKSFPEAFPPQFSEEPRRTIEETK
jgi:hypothetical protein